MPHNPEQILIYHITDVTNLPGIITEKSLCSDAMAAKRNPEIIGYDHIKKRRLEEISVPCCGGRLVGEFVPFYFCPRSPMLFTVNKGKTGRPVGCQRTIVHLVSTMAAGLAVGRAWAISSGNAGARYTTFSSKLDALEMLNWEAIHAKQWDRDGMRYQKSAEFLVADFFPWTAIREIGCENSVTADKTRQLLAGAAHQPAVNVKPSWYY